MWPSFLGSKQKVFEDKRKLEGHEADKILMKIFIKIKIFLNNFMKLKKVNELIVTLIILIEN